LDFAGIIELDLIKGLNFKLFGLKKIELYLFKIKKFIFPMLNYLNYGNLCKIIENRRSIRDFKEDFTVSKEDIQRILLSANLAPSARNLHPLEYIIVTEPELKYKLAKACRQKQPSQVSTNIIVIGDMELAGKIGEISPHDVTTKEKGISRFVYMDAAVAIENILLTATSLEIDSLFIGSFDDAEMCSLFDLPQGFIPIAVICLGKRKKDPGNILRREIQDRIHINKFSSKKHDFSYLEYGGKINPIEEF
jgi:nitroreductase